MKKKIKITIECMSFLHFLHFTQIFLQKLLSSYIFYKMPHTSSIMYVDINGVFDSLTRSLFLIINVNVYLLQSPAARVQSHLKVEYTYFIDLNVSIAY